MGSVRRCEIVIAVLSWATGPQRGNDPRLLTPTSPPGPRDCHPRRSALPRRHRPHQQLTGGMAPLRHPRLPRTSQDPHQEQMRRAPQHLASPRPPHPVHRPRGHIPQGPPSSTATSPRSARRSPNPNRDGPALRVKAQRRPHRSRHRRGVLAAGQGARTTQVRTTQRASANPRGPRPWASSRSSRIAARCHRSWSSRLHGGNTRHRARPHLPPRAAGRRGLVAASEAAGSVEHAPKSA